MGKEIVKVNHKNELTGVLSNTLKKSPSFSRQRYAHLTVEFKTWLNISVVILLNGGPKSVIKTIDRLKKYRWRQMKIILTKWKYSFKFSSGSLTNYSWD